MAVSLLRIRRPLSLFSTLIRPINSTSSSPLSLMISSTSIEVQNPSFNLIQQLSHFYSQSRSFRSSTISLFSSRPRQQYDEGEKIDPNAILFEGCDYNHWLITIDFPKDPRPTPEEMVETYVQTAAKVVGSVEEAKKRIYACSTTTYEGFQIEVSEEMSQKFEGLPGVVFVLPDSYIDPVNKEYGGDKYENGKITYRPPPIQYRKAGGGGRFNDGNRGFDRSDSYQRRVDTRGSGYQQNNNNFPPRTDQRREHTPMSNNNNNNYNAHGNYGQGDRGNYNPQGRRDFQSGPRNYPPPQTGNYGPGAAAGYLGQGGAGGNFGQGAASGNFGQGAARDNFRQGASSGNFRQGASTGGDGFQQGGSDGFGQESVGNYMQGIYRQGASTGGDGFRQEGSDGFGQESVGNYTQGGGDGLGQGAGGGFGQESGENNRPRGQPSASQGDFEQGQYQGFENIPRID